MKQAAHGTVTAHELARCLLAGPNSPVMLKIGDAKDTAYTRCEISVSNDADGVIVEGWVSSDDKDVDSFAPWADYDEDDEDD
jgi:hypothetical protein